MSFLIRVLQLSVLLVGCQVIAYRNGLAGKLGYPQGPIQTPIYQPYKEQTGSAPQQKPWMPNQKRTHMTGQTQKSSLPNHHHQLLPRGFQQRPGPKLLKLLLHLYQAHKNPSIAPDLCTLIENVAKWLKGSRCVQKENQMQQQPQRKPLLSGILGQSHLHPDLLAMLHASPSWLHSLVSIPKQKPHSNVPEEPEKPIYMPQRQMPQRHLKRLKRPIYMAQQKPQWQYPRKGS